MKAIYFYAGLACICLTACLSQTTDTIAHSTETDGAIAAGSAIKEIAFFNGPRCYVLCDFSFSQDSDSREDIAQNALAIFKQIHTRFAVSYININSSQLEKPFFEYVPPGTNLLQTPKEKKQREARAGQTIANLATVLNQLKTADKTTNTCITRALGRVANDLAADPANKRQPVRIIILSDMLEDCNYSFGNINLEKLNYKTAKASLSKMKRPEFRFDGYRNIDISITASSRRPIANTNGLWRFWKEVLAKYDYILYNPITPSLPSWISTMDNE